MVAFDPRLWLVSAAAWWLLYALLWPGLTHAFNEVSFVLSPLLGGLL